MNVLYLTEFFPEKSENITGGVEARSFFLLKNLDKTNKFFIISSRFKNQEEKTKIFKQSEIFRCGKEGNYLHKGGLLQRYNYLRSGYKQAVKILKENNIDIIEASGWMGSLLARKLLKKFNKPTILTYHEVWIGKWKNLFGISGIIGEYNENKILKTNWTKIIAVSEETKKDLIKNGVPENKIIMIHNGVDENELYDLEISKYEKPTIILVSRLVKYKRVNDLIEAIRKLNKNFDLRIIGTGPELENLQNSSKGLSVIFEGQVKSHDELIEKIKKSHLLAFPSEKEGFGIVLVEAMAAGTPYIASDIPVFKEVTNNGEGGLLFKTGDIEDIITKIKVLFNNKKLYSEKIEEGKILSKKYKWPILANKMNTLYAHLHDD